MSQAAVSSRLYDLWVANGKPERIGYSATNGYVDAGVRWVATASTFCAGGALGLYESGGRLYGKWCGVEGVAAEKTISKYYSASGDAHTVASPFNFSPVTVTNPFPGACTVVVSGACDDYLLINGKVAATTFGGGFPPISFALAAGASFVLAARNRSPMYSGDGVNYSVTVSFSAPEDINAVVARAAVVQLAAAGVPWLTANVWSRAGEWVRRKTWSDSAMMIRHEAGPGSVRAVAVFKSASVPAARPVKNSEFGQAEFGALDWVRKYPPPAGDLDLTDAMIAVDASLWVLWKSGGAGTPTNPTDPTNPTNPTDPTNPTNPTDPTNPTNPTDPTNPTNPTDPTNPSTGCCGCP